MLSAVDKYKHEDLQVLIFSQFLASKYSIGYFFWYLNNREAVENEFPNELLNDVIREPQREKTVEKKTQDDLSVLDAYMNASNEDIFEHASSFVETYYDSIVNNREDFPPKKGQLIPPEQDYPESDDEGINEKLLQKHLLKNYEENLKIQEPLFEDPYEENLIKSNQKHLEQIEDYFQKEFEEMPSIQTINNKSEIYPEWPEEEFKAFLNALLEYGWNEWLRIQSILLGHSIEDIQSLAESVVEYCISQVTTIEEKQLLTEILTSKSTYESDNEQSANQHIEFILPINPTDTMMPCQIISIELPKEMERRIGDCEIEMFVHVWDEVKKIRTHVITKSEKEKCKVLLPAPGFKGEFFLKFKSKNFVSVSDGFVINALHPLSNTKMWKSMVDSKLFDIVEKLTGKRKIVPIKEEPKSPENDKEEESKSSDDDSEEDEYNNLLVTYRTNWKSISQNAQWKAEIIDLVTFTRAEMELEKSKSKQTALQSTE